MHSASNEKTWQQQQDHCFLAAIQAPLFHHVLDQSATTSDLNQENPRVLTFCAFFKALLDTENAPPKSFAQKELVLSVKSLLKSVSDILGIEEQTFAAKLKKSESCFVVSLLAAF